MKKFLAGILIIGLIGSTFELIAERDTLGRILAIFAWLAVLILYRSRAFE
jgi:hypothetical protein